MVFSNYLFVSFFSLFGFQWTAKSFHSSFDLVLTASIKLSPSTQVVTRCFCAALPLVGPSGLEPPTSRLSGVRSNHLSYEPVCAVITNRMVEMVGVEPMTSCLQGRRSPNWATPPYWEFSKVWSLEIEQRLDILDFWVAISNTLKWSFGLASHFSILRTFSIERRWSSRTFRYGYLVTT